MIQTVCDHCGQPIGRDEDWVNISVADRTRMRLPKKGSLLPTPERLDVSLDLHRECYVEHYRSALQPPK